MTSTITMMLLLGLYVGLTAFTLAALQAHRHSPFTAVAALNLPR
jgi:hypothetical protein